MNQPIVITSRHSLLNKLPGLVLLMCLTLYSAFGWADSITVKTDRQNVELGDIVTLTIDTDFQTSDSKLDLSTLKDQFDVINKQQSNQISIVNGSYSSHTIWRIQILPKQVGTLMIPPFEINGVKSQPYPIKVTKAQYSDDNRPYFLESSVDKTQAYVQEQIIYTLRFYHKGSLVNGNIRPPQFGNALVESLKEQSVYGKTINGQQYTVYEWQYALFPQSSGDFAISAPSFTGVLHLRGKQKGVQSVAKKMVIKVLPAVKNPQGYWLPAHSLSLTQKWQNLPDTIRVGDSLRRIITLEVDGLKESQLPTITTQNGQNYKVYADEAKNNQTLSEKGVHSIKVISQAIVPTQEGTLTLPDEKITWWNTQTQRLETTVLKSQPLTIWAADPSNTNIPPVTQTTSNTNKAENALNQGKNQELNNQYIRPNYSQVPEQASVLLIPFWVWPIMLAVVISLWLITLLLLLRTRKQINALQLTIGKNPTVITENGSVQQSFNHQWCEMPLPSFYKELLRQLHDDLNINNVDAIPNEKLKAAIFQLEAHLFAGQNLDDRTQQTICDNWASLITRHNTQAKKKGELTDLYQN
ncbi:BatD family protein [Thiomicrorhabdus sp. Milos-T2]|uniref:BatD family protein n=1 Tax=Thiomicrorhabdus sp. Milos-T2 TaxID=90814 RepID=UPI000493EB76|nr:BatD family protein [Thiomicrorhabdus sp. Milos-T2]